MLVAGGAGYGGSASAAVTVLPGAVIVNPPRITTHPVETTLAQFTQLDVWITSPYAHTAVAVTLRGVQVASGTTDASGGYISGDVPVPSGTAACGANEVDWIDGGDLVTSTELTVYCPTVQVTPNQIGSAGGMASFTVSGTGYPPGRSVVLTLDGAQSGFDNAYTDGNGEFTKATSRPALPCGTHRLTAAAQPPPTPGWVNATGASTVDGFPPLPASTTFTVTGCVTPPPVLVANPAVITDGTLTHVTGTGFPPGQPVTLLWATTAGLPLSPCSPDAISTAAPVADAQGRIDTYCLARAHQVLGAVQIVALPGAVDLDTLATLARLGRTHVAAPVVVEGGSMQPSSGEQFVFRR